MPEVTKALKELSKDGDRLAGLASREIADEVAQEQRRLLTMRSHPPRTRTPSNPGQPPAMISGDLMNSVKAIGPTRGSSEGYRVSKAGATTRYARIHELGGDTGRARLPARPSLQPAWRLVRRHVPRIVRNLWRELR